MLSCSRSCVRAYTPGSLMYSHAMGEWGATILEELRDGDVLIVSELSRLGARCSSAWKP